MTYSFSVHQPKDFTEAEIAEGLEFSNRIGAEIMPESPPTPLEQALAAHRTMPARIRRISIRVRAENGQIVGSTGAGFDPEHDDNPDIMWGSVAVDADHRRHGIGARLLSYVVAIAQKEGRSRMISNTVERARAGAAMAQALGMESKQANHINQLAIADVDRSLMERWVADGPSRAAEYEVFGWDGPVPEEHMEKFLDTVLVMNTAPRDDLEMNDFTITAGEIREGEERLEAMGGESWTVVARHRTSGDWAGFHDVTWMPSDPKVVWVGATGVRPEHRGHALGKWLKAAITLRVLDERPDVENIRTGNADSNDAMLGINKEMGYKPFIGTMTWEAPVETVAAWLKEKDLDLPEIPAF